MAAEFLGVRLHGKCRGYRGPARAAGQLDPERAAVICELPVIALSPSSNSGAIPQSEFQCGGPDGRLFRCRQQLSDSGSDNVVRSQARLLRLSLEPLTIPVHAAETVRFCSLVSVRPHLLQGNVPRPDAPRFQPLRKRLRRQRIPPGCLVNDPEPPRILGPGAAVLA